MVVPSRGDIVWLDFDPIVGREQRGRRPAIVVSDEKFNRVTGLSIVCPITSRVKGLLMEVLIEVNGVSGAILVSHVKSLDWRQRRLDFIAKAPNDVVVEVQARLRTVLVD